jgi:hypothetical protein
MQIAVLIPLLTHNKSLTLVVSDTFSTTSKLYTLMNLYTKGLSADGTKLSAFIKEY